MKKTSFFEGKYMNHNFFISSIILFFLIACGHTVKKNTEKESLSELKKQVEIEIVKNIQNQKSFVKINELKISEFKKTHGSTNLSFNYLVSYENDSKEDNAGRATLTYEAVANLVQISENHWELSKVQGIRQELQFHDPMVITADAK